MIYVFAAGLLALWLMVSQLLGFHIVLIHRGTTTFDFIVDQQRKARGETTPSPSPSPSQTGGDQASASQRRPVAAPTAARPLAVAAAMSTGSAHPAQAAQAEARDPEQERWDAARAEEPQAGVRDDDDDDLEDEEDDRGSSGDNVSGGIELPTSTAIVTPQHQRVQTL